MKLSPTGRTALWIGGGGFIGLAIGALLVSPGRAVELAPLWLVSLAVFGGIVVGVTRVRDASAAPAPRKAKSAASASPRATLTPSATEPLAVRFEFPDVPAGYPTVLGRGEPLQVTVQVLRSGQPAEGAGVQLHATMGDGELTGDGVTGNTGEVEFTLEPEGTGELHLTAEAKADARTGRGAATVSIVDYDVEIDRLFGEFRAYAVGVLGGEANSDTARELCDKLRVRADPETARALLELARIYELVAYGEREADRRLYLAVLQQLLFLEQAELPGPSLAREA